MKISYNWLKQYLDIDLSPDELSELLTGCGLEVERIETWQSLPGGLENFVIGEVLTCKKHPDADRLSVTTVDTAEGKPLHIVCGAPNVAARQKVVVAKVGATVTKGDESFEIKRSKIRGELSEGMICAEDEMGIGDDHEGIMVLEASVKPGTPASEYFKIENDIVYEIGLTPNRTDAISHIGVARDIKAVLENRDFQQNISAKRELNTPSVDHFKADNHNLQIPVTIENPEACPRYTGVTLTGLKVGESPDWLKNRLNAIGVRPINNLVDITNYVLHETGQPLHAFDADEITGNHVVVKKMQAGTKFVTLDEEERELSSDDLMICNEEEGMCIGGVFGGIKSGVTEKTTSIFLESAYFDPVHIRKTSKRHDLQTDASFRFERGVDPEMVIYALKRAALLMKEIAGGSISSGIVDEYPEPMKPAEVIVSWSHIDRLIGKAIGKETIKNILHSLEFKVEEESDTGLKLTVPMYRVDVTREADVIEEILRIYGYNNIEIPYRQLSAVSHKEKPDNERLVNLVSDYLVSNGFTEIMNNSLTKSRYYENYADFDAKQSVEMINPLSRDLNVMRQSMLFGGLETILHNLNRKNENLKLFEYGRSYQKNPGADIEAVVTKRFSEERMLALFVTGKKDPESWYLDQKPVDVHFLKAMAMNIFQRLGIDTRTFKWEEDKSAAFHGGISYSQNNKVILRLGEISKALLLQFDIGQPVYYAEINWEMLPSQLKKAQTLYEPIPKFPEVRRDLALLLNKETTFAEVEQLAFDTERKLLKKVNLFDVYEGKNIDADKKSYAVSFTLYDKEKTLTDKVIDKTMNKLMKVYEEKLGAVIR